MAKARLERAGPLTGVVRHAAPHTNVVGQTPTGACPTT
jgi:hypothetical protein